MKPGDMVRFHFGGAAWPEDVVEGLILEVILHNEELKKRQDDFLRWFSARVLVGDRDMLIHLYWDDQVEILR